MYRILGKVCYVLAGLSIVFSLGTQFKMLQGTPLNRRGWFQRAGTGDAHSERQSIFFGLWAPTFAIFGKVLDDMGKQSQTSPVIDVRVTGNATTNTSKSQEPAMSNR